MDLEFDLSDLKESAVRRLLAAAIKRESSRTKPAHKRDEDVQKEIEEEDDEEGEKLTELHEDSKGKPSPVPVTEEDLSEQTADDLKKKAAPKGKK